MSMGMGFPMRMGIPWEWESRGNLMGMRMTPTWEWERKRVGMNVGGNGNDPYFHDPYSHGKKFSQFLLL